jgi:hypothetical protein
VIDVIGSIITQQEVISIEGENEVMFDLGNVAGGIYFLTIDKQGEKTKTVRIAVE